MDFKSSSSKHIILEAGLKLPSSARTAIFNSQYCSLFFRPWTLLNGSSRVPHLSLLGLRWEAMQEVYDTTSQRDPKKQKLVSLSEEKKRQSIFDQVDWGRAWDEYVRGHVVSQNAANLIKSFLLKTMAAAAKGGDSESEADESEDDNTNDVPRLQLPAMKLRELLSPSSNTPVVPDEDNENPSLAQKLIRSTQNKIQKKKKTEYEKSMQIGQAVWSSPHAEGAAEDRGKPGNMFEDTYEEHIAALSDTRSKCNSHTQRRSTKREMLLLHGIATTP